MANHLCGQEAFGALPSLDTGIPQFGQEPRGNHRWIILRKGGGVEVGNIALCPSLCQTAQGGGVSAIALDPSVVVFNMSTSAI